MFKIHALPNLCLPSSGCVLGVTVAVFVKAGDRCVVSATVVDVLISEVGSTNSSHQRQVKNDVCWK